jgi:hypothetical protein
MKNFLLFVFTMFFSISAMNAQTVVFEDGFESYEDGYNLTGAGYSVWEGTAKVTDVTAEGVTATANSGDKFGKSDASKNNFAFRKAFTLEAGKTYTWEVATKIQDGVKHTLQVNPTSTYQKVDVTNDDWQKHSIQFTVQEGFEEVTLAVYRWAKKVVSFDDFKLIDNSGTSTQISEVPEFSVSMFPNPTNGELHIQHNTMILSLNVYDITGKLIDVQNSIDQKHYTMDMTAYKKGIYFVTLYDVEEKSHTQKVVVK